MMSSKQLFQSVIGLSADSDWPSGRVRDIIFHGPDSPFPPKHIPHYQLIGDTVYALYCTYEFNRSPKFLASISGKTSDFARMKLKLDTTAEKREMHQKNFLEALDHLPSSRDAYDLLDSAQHAQLDKIVDALAQIEREEPAPSPPLTARSSRQELDSLLDETLHMALQLLAKHGSHIPFAMLITPTGTRASIVADDSSVHDGEVLFATVRAELIKAIQQQGVRSFALARMVHHDRRDTVQSSDAVQVQLEHIDGTSVTCYLPYQISDGKQALGEVFAMNSTEKFFP